MTLFNLLGQATLETVLMVGIASGVAVLGGLPLAVLLFLSRSGGLAPHPLLCSLLGGVINAIRSVPYIILVIALLPITRWLTGTSIGMWAATVPLSLAAIMLFCRVAEDALQTVPKGLVEAGVALGANRWQIVSKILLPEALPPLISGLTLVMINLVGFSAMAGTVGGGGLGDLAIRYGYQRYDLLVVAEVIIILLLLVQGLQSAGEKLTQRLRPV